MYSPTNYTFTIILRLMSDSRSAGSALATPSFSPVDARHSSGICDPLIPAHGERRLARRRSPVVSWTPEAITFST